MRAEALTAARAHANLPSMIARRTTNQQKRRSLAAFVRADLA